MRFFRKYKISGQNGSALTVFYLFKFLVMHTIVFASHKGGCGRSTLAISLAVAAQEAGESVAIFDLDPKSCASRWGSKRMDRKLPVRTPDYTRLRRALSAAARRKATLAIIDTPVLESPATLAAVKTADLTIVPARPSQFDIWAAEVTGRRMTLMNERFLFLLNQCPPRGQSRRIQECIAALAATGPLLAPQLGMSQRFLEAAEKGRGVTEIDHNGRAGEEMRNLWLAIKRSF